jgi:hypothetical protein
MSFQDENGTWWSNDKRYYRVGNQWILNSGTPSTSQPSRADQQTAQTEGTRYTLGTSNSFDVVDTFSQFPQYSAEPYQQPQQLTFGSNRQTPGEKPSPVIDLDPEFRASASSSRMLQAFVQARDKMAAGKVS